MFANHDSANMSKSPKRGSMCIKLITHQYYKDRGVKQGRKKTFSVQRRSRQEMIDGAPPIDYVRASSSAPTVNKRTFLRWVKRAN